MGDANCVPTRFVVADENRPAKEPLYAALRPHEAVSAVAPGPAECEKCSNRDQTGCRATGFFRVDPLGAGRQDSLAVNDRPRPARGVVHARSAGAPFFIRICEHAVRELLLHDPVRQHRDACFAVDISRAPEAQNERQFSVAAADYLAVRICARWKRDPGRGSAPIKDSVAVNRSR